MAWRLVGHPKTLRVTKKLAEQYRSMEPVPDERPLSEIRLKVYEKLALEGKFRPVTWAEGYCKETGSTYRVNGQHTSTVFSGLDPLPELYAVQEVYMCDTLEDVAKLYSTFDSKIQSRTVSDINRAFASCVTELIEIPLRIINICVPAVWYARLQRDYKEMQPQERAEALLHHPDFVTWAYRMVGSSGSTNVHLKRMPVFAAMFATYQKYPRLAEQFWAAVRDESGTTPDLPDRKLAKFLLTHSMRISDRHRSYRSIISEREFFVKCLHAWNARRLGESTNLNYYPKAEVPAIK